LKFLQNWGQQRIKDLLTLLLVTLMEMFATYDEKVEASHDRRAELQCCRPSPRSTEQQID